MKKSYLKVGIMLLVICTLMATMSLSYAARKNITEQYGLAPINDEKAIEMLKESGKVAQDASYEEAMEVLQELIKTKEAVFSEESGELKDKTNRSMKIKLEKALNKSNVFNGKGNKLGHTSKNLPSVVEESYSGDQRTDRVLAILIDFPDFKANDITAEDSDMYYEDYVKSHYYDMLFSETGYEGPNGENFISMKQYYEDQSGGSYSVEGKVAGWYTASEPAAYYGGNGGTGNDKNPRGLVKEALLAAAADESIDLSWFDQEDRYDLDGDGNTREPDGLVDHLMVFHASVGEEAGGGQLGDDAIWSHRWNLGNVFPLDGTTADAPYWGGAMAAYDYTIQPADGAAGVCAHEYGHDLGLPDEYDTAYSGNGEAVSYWSIMSSGSWVGEVPGTEPSGFSPWAKQFFQANMGGNWLTGAEITLDDLEEGNLKYRLDEASTKGTNNDIVRISLPDKETVVSEPVSGEYMYYSQKGNDLQNTMSNTVDLTNATEATLKFKVNYKIEKDWDYGFVYVNTEDGLVALPGTITEAGDPNGNLASWGWPEGTEAITGTSNGWIDAEFDLSAFVGQEITYGIMYMTDSYVAEPGIYVDDISVVVNDDILLEDNAEEETTFELNGFAKDTGIVKTPHYYLLEWRNHSGVDTGLGHIPRGDGTMAFEEGLLVWYADDFYDNNHVGNHPGNGFIGVVDADQDVLKWSNGELASTRYQIHDAAFGLEKADKMSFSYPEFSIKDHKRKFATEFDDSESYVNSEAPDGGRDIPMYGIKVKVIGEANDRSVADIIIGQ